MLSVEEQVSASRRQIRLYHVTAAGRAANLDWLRQPVDPASIVNDLGLHVMRFVMMEKYLGRAEVLAFLTSLADALDGFVSGVERFLGLGRPMTRHGRLAVEHGLAMHRASLEWTHSTMAELGREAPVRSG